MALIGTSSQVGRLGGDWMIPCTRSSGPPQLTPSRAMAVESAPCSASISRIPDLINSRARSGPWAGRVANSLRAMTSGGVEESRTAVFVPPISIPTSSLFSDVFTGSLLFPDAWVERPRELPFRS